MNFKKYIVEDHSDGKKYEVIADELGYIHKQLEQEQKAVSFKDIERLYKKEFGGIPEKNGNPQQPVNEVRKLKQLIDNAHQTKNF